MFVLAAAILALLTLLFVLFVSSKRAFCEPFQQLQLPKTIWILWFQGWEEGKSQNVPWLVQKVRQSWEYLNPDYQVVLLSSQNLKQYLPDLPLKSTMTLPAQSDLIRLALLSTYGGVWVDATLLCMVPLSLWTRDALKSGFWMYHGRDEGKGPASWFMMSEPGHYIPAVWYARALDYWKSKDSTDDYWWMDALFKELYLSDSDFKNEWDKVPYLWCDANGQSHMLAGKTTSDDADVKELLQRNPPYVVKLSHKGFGDPRKDVYLQATNTYFAIKCALQKKQDYVLHEFQDNFE